MRISSCVCNFFFSVGVLHREKTASAPENLGKKKEKKTMKEGDKLKVINTCYVCVLRLICRRTNAFRSAELKMNESSVIVMNQCVHMFQAPPLKRLVREKSSFMRTLCLIF